MAPITKKSVPIVIKLSLANPERTSVIDNTSVSIKIDRATKKMISGLLMLIAITKKETTIRAITKFWLSSWSK